MSFKVIFKHSHPPNVFCELTRNVTGVIILLIYLLLHICFSNLWQRTPRIVTYHRENRIVLKVHLLVFPFSIIKMRLKSICTRNQYVQCFQ